MTTTQNDKTDVRSVNPPSLFNIQYPNSRTGMFSLRPPFKDFHTDQSQERIPTRNANPTPVQPKYLHMDRDPPPLQRSYDQEISRRDAEVQCSLILPENRERIVTRRQPTFVTEPSNYGHLSPRYRVQLKLQPAQPNIYDVWNVETPPPRSLPPNEPIRRRERSIRPRSPRLISIKSLSDDESDSTDDDDDAYLLYTHYPPAPVRMVHLRQDASTICY